jgi:2-C-methyl-D-erythritol 4-phosphate cytidylyltransferase
MSRKQPVWAIIPASGIGNRMQSDTVKQYLSFQGKTVIEHCLDRLLSHAQIDAAIIVLNEKDTSWADLDYNSEKPVFTAVGGSQRQDSVYSGLLAMRDNCGEEALALVHDVVRPLVTHDDLSKVIAAARGHSIGAILATPVADTLKLENDDMGIARSVSRDHLWRAFTPQVFHLKALLLSLEAAIQQNISLTDDASALEMQGYSPALVAGDSSNIKITNPGDLGLAELIWLNQLN